MADETIKEEIRALLDRYIMDKINLQRMWSGSLIIKGHMKSKEVVHAEIQQLHKIINDLTKIIGFKCDVCGLYSHGPKFPVQEEDAPTPRIAEGLEQCIECYEAELGVTDEDRNG